MKINQSNWKWWLTALIAAIIFKNWRRPIGIITMILGLPYFYHLFKQDDMKDPIQLVMFFAGLFLIWW